MPNIKVIACDLDGTLLLNGAQQLQPNTCDLIEQLTERGILFIAASGRQYTNLRRLFAPVADRIGYICENGCLGFFGGKRLFRETFDQALGQEIRRAIQKTPGTEVLLSGETVSYLEPKEQSYTHHVRDVLKNDVLLVPDILNTPEPYMKISVYESSGIQDAQRWEREFGDRCTVVTGGNAWLDMMPTGVNKATGLARMLHHLNISPEACMAIGDNDNDREMLELVRYPVAVKSAKPGIRSLAKLETDTVEHLFEQILAGALPRIDET